MSDNHTTFCHHVEWFHDPLTLYANLNGREVVYCANAPRHPLRLPEGASDVVYIHTSCLECIEDDWWVDGVCVERPDLPVMDDHHCCVCDDEVPEMYRLPLGERR